MATDIEREIEGIYTRLTRETALRHLLGTEDKRVSVIAEVTGTDATYATLLAGYLFNFDPARIARSELRVNQEEVQALDMNVALVRNWLLQNGRPPLTSEEQDQVATGGRLRTDDKYWFCVESEGELDQRGFIGPTRLFAEEFGILEGVNVKIQFGFDNTYQLEIDYYRDPSKPEFPSAGYYPRIRPVTFMARNEAVIIQGVLNDFMKDRGTTPTP